MTGLSGFVITNLYSMEKSVEECIFFISAAGKLILKQGQVTEFKPSFMGEQMLFSIHFLIFHLLWE
jgi:hypothetical protein